MVFSGQGTQWAGCGRALYDADPVFRRVIDAVEEEWRRHSEISLRDACFSARQEELNEVQLAQPAIFMIQCALVELLATWGVHPGCVVGHSSGEVAAAYACGALSLAEATRLVYHRATLQQRVAGSGRMLAIGLDRPGVESLLGDLSVRSGNVRAPQVEIACENAPANTVVCGRESALGPVIEELRRLGLQNRLIPGNIAFHSTAMDPLHDDAMAALSFLNERGYAADVPMVSSVTGKTALRLDNAYWWSNIREPVRFAAAMDTVRREYRPDVFLEVAPHSALQPLIRQCLEGGVQVPACIPSLMKDQDVCLGFQEALGVLFRAGVTLDVASQYPRPEPIAHLLPGYPKEETTTRDDMVPWLTDHRVHRAAIIPAAGFIELLLQAFSGDPVHIEELEFLQHCPVPTASLRLQTALYRVPNAPDQYTFTISSRPFENDDEGTLHCRGRVRRVGSDFAVDALASLDDVRESFDPVPLMTGEDFYSQVEAVVGDAFEFGPRFRGIRQIDIDSASTDLLLKIGSPVAESLARRSSTSAWNIFRGRTRSPSTGSSATLRNSPALCTTTSTTATPPFASLDPMAQSADELETDSCLLRPGGCRNPVATPRGRRDCAGRRTGSPWSIRQRFTRSHGRPSRPWLSPPSKSGRRPPIWRRSTSSAERTRTIRRVNKRSGASSPFYRHWLPSGWRMRPATVA